MQDHQEERLPDIRHTILLEATIDKVWKAVATSDGIAAWFMPNTFQPVLGSEFTLDSGLYGTSHCKVIEFDPPRRLSFTWGEDWQVSFELREVEGKTELTLIHSGWKSGKLAVESGEVHDVIRDRMDNGWGSIVLKRLREVVEE